jgi:predicted cobalt transporter CbtA
LKAIWLIFVTLAAGVVAGTFFGIMNLAIAEPLVDKAISFEVARQVNAGHPVDYAQMADYRNWQKGGEVVSAVVLGMALSAIFGIVFAYTRKALPGKNNVRKGIVLAGIIWFALFFVTSLKYPANPPAVEAQGTTIYFRQELYVAFLAISGLGLFGAAYAAMRYKERIKPIVLIPLIYVPIIAGAYFALPPNGYEVTTEMKSLVDSFRIVSELDMGMLWAVIGLTSGLLWDRFKPQLETDQTLRSV